MQDGQALGTIGLEQLTQVLFNGRLFRSHSQGYPP